MAHLEQAPNSIKAYELKLYAKIEEVIGQTHELIGSGHWLRLKDHDSCVIDTQSQRFYWNSRNLDGDVYDWLMTLHNWDFAEAKAYVIRLASLDLDSDNFSLPQPKERTRDRCLRRLSPPPPKVARQRTRSSRSG